MTVETLQKAMAVSPEYHYLHGTDGHLFIRCEAPADAVCRNQCTREKCLEEGCRCGDPQLRPLGYCNVQEWLSGDGIDWTAADFRLPVVTEWAGEGFRWRPAPDQRGATA